MSARVKIVRKLIEINENIIFYPRLKRFYKKVFKDSTPFILDIGSNKGQSIDFFLNINKNCKIIGFEPNPKLYNFLITKYKNKDNIRIENMGVSDSVGKLMFNENILDETSSFEELDEDSTYLSTKSRVLGVDPKDIIVNQYEVDVTDMQSFIKKENISNIDLIKIDVEGHEYQCLQGLFSEQKMNTDIRFIQLESHNDDMYKNKKLPEEIPNLLSSNGFVECQKIKHGFGDFYEVIYQNKNTL